MNDKQRSALSKIFSVSGALLLWVPILFMLFTGIIGSFATKALLFDYLTLAELFPIVALGLLLLVLGSGLSRHYAKWFGWGAALALILLAGGQLLASSSGLSAGTLADGGAVLAVVIITVALFDLIVAALAVLSIFLLRKLFAKHPPDNAGEID